MAANAHKYVLRGLKLIIYADTQSRHEAAGLFGLVAGLEAVQPSNAVSIPVGILFEVRIRAFVCHLVVSFAHVPASLLSVYGHISLQVCGKWSFHCR